MLVMEGELMRLCTRSGILSLLCSHVAVVIAFKNMNTRCSGCENLFALEEQLGVAYVLFWGIASLTFAGGMPFLGNKTDSVRIT